MTRGESGGLPSPPCRTFTGCTGTSSPGALRLRVQPRHRPGPHHRAGDLPVRRRKGRTSMPHVPSTPTSDVPPAAPWHRRTARSRRSPARAAWRWRRATSGISGKSGSRSWIPGRWHKRNDRILRAGQDRRPAQERGLEPDRRFECAVRTCAAGQHAGLLRSLPRTFAIHRDRQWPHVNHGAAD